MNQAPKISVVMPVYNTEQYLHECLDGILGQTFPNIEIICVNDGSTDSSAQILQDYANQDQRVKVIHKDHTNAGDARNVGMAAATGEYLWFIDSDDKVSVDSCDEINRYITRYSDVDIIIFDAVDCIDGFIYESKGRLNRGYLPKENPFLPILHSTTLFYISTPAPWNKVFKTSFIKEMFLQYQSISSCNDIAFTRLSFASASKIGYIEKILYQYNRTAMGSISRTRGKKARNIISVTRYVKKHLKIYNKYSLYSNCFHRITASSFRYEAKNASFLNKVILFLYLSIFQLRIEDRLWGFQSDLVKKYKKIKAKYMLFKKNRLIVSLTSYPARISTVHLTIISLLNQNKKADSVILWLATEQFPNLENDLPETLVALKKQGLIIDWCNDIKSYKKLIPTLKKYPDDVIITADDDVIYPKNFIEILYNAYVQEPSMVHAHRCHQVKIDKGRICNYRSWVWYNTYKTCKPSYINFFTGIGGVLYPPRSLHQNVLNEEKFMELCPRGDDIWFWAMAILAGTKINSVKNKIENFTNIEGTQETSLWHENKESGNDLQITALIQEYPEVLKIISTEYKKTKAEKNKRKLIGKIKTENKKIYKFLGASVFKKVIKKNKAKYYILGVCVFKRKTKIKKSGFVTWHEVNNRFHEVQRTIASFEKKIEGISISSEAVQTCLNSYTHYEPKKSVVNDLIKRDFHVISRRENFHNDLFKLISGLDPASINNVLKIIGRSNLVLKNKELTNIFTVEEVMALNAVSDFRKSIHKITDDLYAYQSYFLPVNHFEASVFLYEHGLHLVRDKTYFLDKAIIDAGAFIGDSGLILSGYTNNKVYSFEAVSENYEIMLRTISLNGLKNIVPIKSALGSEDGEIKINFYGGASSALDIDASRSKYSEMCAMTSLDKFVQKEGIQVGLIKIDIEGFEQELLKGAINTIKSQKPVLLISIYHNTDDFLKIKPMIEELNVGYSFQIYKPIDGSLMGETLLICQI